MRRIPIFVHPLDKTEIFLKFLFYMYTCLYLNCMSEETRRWLIRLRTYVYPEAMVTVKTAAINKFNTVPYMGVSRLLLPSL